MMETAPGQGSQAGLVGRLNREAVGLMQRGDATLMQRGDARLMQRGDATRALHMLQSALRMSQVAPSCGPIMWPHLRMSQVAP